MELLVFLRNLLFPSDIKRIEKALSGFDKAIAQLEIGIGEAEERKEANRQIRLALLKEDGFIEASQRRAVLALANLRKIIGTELV